MILLVCKTNLYSGACSDFNAPAHHLQRPLWKGTWNRNKPGYGFPNLTIGKIYQCEFVKTNNNIGENDNYKLVDDSGEKFLYPKSVFITIEEFREERLTELLK